MKILSFHIIYAGENVGFCQVLPARGCQMQQMQHIKKGEVPQVHRLKKDQAHRVPRLKKEKAGDLLFSRHSQITRNHRQLFLIAKMRAVPK